MSMNKSLLTIGSVLIAVLFVAPGIAAIETDTAPTFYFTRLVYSENSNGRSRGFSRGTMPTPEEQFVCPEFGGGNFFPRQGWGWATDYPGGDCKFMGGVHRLTGIRVHPNPHV